MYPSSSSGSARSQVLAGLVALAGSASGQLSTRPAVFPGLDILGPGISSNLPLTTASSVMWATGYIPMYCKYEAGAQGVSPYDIQVFNITYSDCSTPWVFCRHKDSPTSQTDMINQFGRLPVKMRNYVRHVISIPTGGGAHAWSGVGDIMIRGAVTTAQALTVWIHEIAHCIDNHNGPGGTSDFSATSTWLTAFNADTAVPDGYATTSQAENFAQNTVVALYDRLNTLTGGIWGQPYDVWKIQNQFTAVETKLGSQLLPGGTCSRGIYSGVTVSSPVVCAGPLSTACLAAGYPLKKRGNGRAAVEEIEKRAVGVLESRKLTLADVPANRTTAADKAKSYRGPLPKGVDANAPYPLNCANPVLPDFWTY
ncbi:hypothetical protein QBC37DRAFT_479401 [Rhypophila decipiens]|uniref:Conidiation-specific protein 13 n=1 Tax=Rhypophila decipiens TaxID=261697 RepID=A0AAN7BBL1_9PEZI|nr:hypothetical protein QBC37DRAFT_479401 [Rhypophila decipiens]